jgi:hypothetical protein
MRTLLAKSYWSRLWVVQEFLLAQSLEIWYGEFCIEYDDLIHADYFIDISDKKTEQARILLRTKGRRSQPGFRSYVLCDLVHAFHAAECTGKADRIYALLGIASDAKPKGTKTMVASGGGHHV